MRMIEFFLPHTRPNHFEQPRQGYRHTYVSHSVSVAPPHIPIEYRSAIFTQLARASDCCQTRDGGGAGETFYAVRKDDRHGDRRGWGLGGTRRNTTSCICPRTPMGTSARIIVCIGRKFPQTYFVRAKYCYLNGLLNPGSLHS